MEISETIRMLQNKHEEWSLPLVVGELDIEFAFDSLSHLAADNGFRDRNAPLQLRCALLATLLHNQVEIHANGVTSEPASLFRGGRQGHSDTPLQWNSQLGPPLQRLRARWMEKGWGL